MKRIALFLLMGAVVVAGCSKPPSEEASKADEQSEVQRQENTVEMESQGGK